MVLVQSTRKNGFCEMCFSYLYNLSNYFSYHQVLFFLLCSINLFYDNRGQYIKNVIILILYLKNYDFHFYVTNLVIYNIFLIIWANQIFLINFNCIVLFLFTILVPNNSSNYIVFRVNLKTPTSMRFAVKGAQYTL